MERFERHNSLLTTNWNGTAYILPALQSIEYEL